LEAIDEAPEENKIPSPAGALSEEAKQEQGLLIIAENPVEKVEH
jgi:hypothetical protein